MNIEDYYKDIRWWENYNPNADWEGLYRSYPDVDWDQFYSNLPKELLPKEELNESGN